jgi:hypothetical protein
MTKKELIEALEHYDDDVVLKIFNPYEDEEYESIQIEYNETEKCIVVY